MTSLIKQNWIVLAAAIVAATIPLNLRAGVATGPKITNSAAAAEELHAQFYDAEQSYQERLKVGRERYEQKQVVRGRILAAMASQLEAREHTVIMQPVPTVLADKDEPVSLDPAVVVALLSAALFGLGFHLYKRKPILIGHLPPGKTAFARYTVE